MTAISIVVAIPFIPSHRTSRKELERGLLYSFTREQFEMQQISELAVVTLLVRYKTVYLSPSWKIRESWKKNPRYREQVREFQKLEKEGRVKWKIKKKTKLHLPWENDSQKVEGKLKALVNSLDQQSNVWITVIVLRVLWTERLCHPPPKFTCWSPNPQSDRAYKGIIKVKLGCKGRALIHQA